jgi:hypothetical protein
MSYFFAILTWHAACSQRRCPVRTTSPIGQGRHGFMVVRHADQFTHPTQSGFMDHCIACLGASVLHSVKTRSGVGVVVIVGRYEAWNIYAFMSLPFGHDFKTVDPMKCPPQNGLIQSFTAEQLGNTANIPSCVKL